VGPADRLPGQAQHQLLTRLGRFFNPDGFVQTHITAGLDHAEINAGGLIQVGDKCVDGFAEHNIEAPILEG
jgi:hypothetical protein